MMSTTKPSTLAATSSQSSFSGNFNSLKRTPKVATVRQQPQPSQHSVPNNSNNYSFVPTAAAATLPSGLAHPQFLQAGSRPQPMAMYRMTSPQLMHSYRQVSTPNSPACRQKTLPPEDVGRFGRSAASMSANILSCIASPMTQRQRGFRRDTPASMNRSKHPDGEPGSAVVLPRQRKSPSPQPPPSYSSGSSSSQDSGIGVSMISNSSSVERQSRATETTRKSGMDPPAVRYRGATLSRPVAKSAGRRRSVEAGQTTAPSTPATPRSSWNLEGSSGLQHRETKSVGRSTSMGSGTLERQRGRRTSVKIPRPTNLGGERRLAAGENPKGLEEDIGDMAKQIQKRFQPTNESGEGKSHLPVPEREFSGHPMSSSSSSSSSQQIAAPRSKTLSPPPQFASAAIRSALRKPSSRQACITAPDSTANNSSIFYSNLDDDSATPTPSTRTTPDPQHPPIATPKVLVDGVAVALEGPVKTRISHSPTHASVPPTFNVGVVGATDDQVYGCLGYGPLSHIKLPYSTPMMQRMQLTTSDAAGVKKSGGNRSASGVAKNVVSASGSSCSSTSTAPSTSTNSAGTQLTLSNAEALGSHSSLSLSGQCNNEGTTYEVAQLKQELDLAHRKVAALTSQLSANASVVLAFEQSLQSMNQRLHQISTSSALKDRELNELRMVINHFKGPVSRKDWPNSASSASVENVRNTNKLSQSQEFVRLDAHSEVDNLHQAESLSSLGSSAGGAFCVSEGHSGRSPLTRGYISPSYMPIRDSLDRNDKKPSWLRSSFSRAFNRRSKSRDLLVMDRDSVPHVTSTSTIVAPTEPDTVIPSPGSGSSVRFSPGSSSSAGESPVRGGPPNGAGVSTRCGAMQGDLMTELQRQVSCLRTQNSHLHRQLLSQHQLRQSEIHAPTHFGVRRPDTLTSILKDLYVHQLPGVGSKAVPVLLELRPPKKPPTSGRNFLTVAGNSGDNAAAVSPNPSVRLHPGVSTSNLSLVHEDIGPLHLLGRVCPELQYANQFGGVCRTPDLRARLKQLFHMYLIYLESEEAIGLCSESIASFTVTTTRANQQAPESSLTSKEYQMHLEPGENDDAGVIRIEPGHAISRVTLRLHDNAYAVEKQAGPSLLNPISTSSMAWISLLPCPLLTKMIESLLTNKCVIIYGPRSSGKLEFGRILIDTMAKMFPGFWVSHPNAIHYYLRATPAATNELRQILLNGLLAVEGLIILRLPPSLLSDLVRIMTELNFNTNPRKVLLLAITDTLVFPEPTTHLPNCPGIFPFLADVQSTAAYMRRCLRQRFSQHAFHILEDQKSAAVDGLDALGEVIEWLPDFWLRVVTSEAAWLSSDDTIPSFPLSPFHLLACPLNLEASATWFRRDFCCGPAEETLLRRLGVAGDLVRWLAATWPWPNTSLEPPAFAFTPALTTTALTSSAAMYNSNTSLSGLCVSLPSSEGFGDRSSRARSPAALASSSMGHGNLRNADHLHQQSSAPVGIRHR